MKSESNPVAGRLATRSPLCQTFVLHDEWTFSAQPPAEGSPHPPSRLTGLKGVVPGCVHTDLLRLGLIGDPYCDGNEQACRWVSHTRWTYRCRFDTPPACSPHETLELVAEGIDTAAVVLLNGVEIGCDQNMHVQQVWGVNDLLRPAGNTLEVRFAAPVDEARRLAALHGDMPRAMPGIEPYNFVRKMACNFGWDWGPSLTTVGLWRPVYLRRYETARLEGVRPLVTRADEDLAELDVYLDIALAPGSDTKPLSYELVLYDPDGRLVTHARGTVTGGETTAAKMRIELPERWWPRGFGKQPLYRLDAWLYSGQMHVLDHQVQRVGLRHIELDQSDDPAGSAFTLRVNGRPVFCRGANWIPDDCFPSRVTPRQVHHRLDQAVGANLNMIRVWGGGLYESDFFYDRCDELGLMVWQDMLFACAMYPESLLRDSVEKEVRQNAARLSTHPSLVLYCGGNENMWFYHERPQWRESVAGRGWGKTFYRKLIPRCLLDVDPTRPYVPGSPDSGRHPGSPNAANHGTMHLWDAWKRDSASSYRAHRPRFASEFGFCGPANPHTLRRAVSGFDGCLPDDPRLHTRFKAGNGPSILSRHLHEVFDPTDRLDTWLYQAQLVQARAVSLGVEWFRSLWPHCGGALFWQLNDCWPAISWSAIGSDGSPKLLWHAIRRAMADRMITVQPDDQGGLSCVLVNDTDEPWSPGLRMRRMHQSGRCVVGSRVDALVAPRSVQWFALADSIQVVEKPESEFVLIDADELRATWFFGPDKDLAYEEPRADVSVRPTSDGCEVHVVGQTLLRDLVLWPDAIAPESRVERQLVTLLPGERHKFVVHCAYPIPRDTASWASALRCANSQLRGCRVVCTDQAAVT
jgi:beta-mannosidase